MHFKFLVVGAGFAGAVLAERIASELGQSVLVVDRRRHVAGNAYDALSSAGVLIHKYGPHYFRTNSRMVIDYLSRFTDWHHVTYRVQSYTHGRFWSFPVNLRTYEQLLGRTSTEEEFQSYLADQRVYNPHPANSEEVILDRAGREFYELFFHDYTIKQWHRHPRELDPSVCGRIPIRTTRDDRFCTEEFQALPLQGYTRMFEKMLAHPRIQVRLGADFREVRGQVSYDHLIYTGPLDEYFDYSEGRLPYRSLKFEEESFDMKALEGRMPVSQRKGFWQPEMQVNYPGPEPFTRIVEIKHATGQKIDATTIVREYPQSDGPGHEPFYPIPSAEPLKVARTYAERAERELRTTFVGRLATYRYLNMDQVVAMAMKEFERIKTQR